EQIIEQFHPNDMLDEALQSSQPDSVPTLSGIMAATNVTLEEEGGIKELDGVSFRINIDQHVAVIGPSGSGRSGVVRIMARLLRPTTGTIRIGEQNLVNMPQSLTGRHISYVDQTPHLFSGTVRENLYYGLMHHPMRPAQYDGVALAEYERFVREAKEAGNSTSDINADWLDHESAGLDGPDALKARMIEVLDLVDLKNDIYAMGLVGTVDPMQRPDLVQTILAARLKLREKMQDPSLARLVEPFDNGTYNVNMSVAENLLFGNPIGHEFDLAHLGQNPYMRKILAKVGLDNAFLETGVRIANIMVELFHDLPPDHEYFERYSFISADELPEFEQLVRRIDAAGETGTTSLSDDERSRLVSLPFQLVVGRHRLGVIDEGIRAQILKARHMFAESLPEDLRGAVAFFDSDKYNGAASIQDNILFGKVVYGRRDAFQRVAGLIHEVVDALGLENEILEVGLESQVGVGGSRMNISQSQKLAIARCVIKRPDIMIINDATAALDPASQNLIAANLFREFEGRGLIWVLGRADQARAFTHALIMQGGKIAEQGPVSELDQPGSMLHELAGSG
ncbi:MAG: ATP-binding cassette domain-containing protein, partial [Proteobacteria bacterium]|nr:ATP-binding cassette domain-containing protein [Pseudomonadota bacterium]